MRPTDEDDSKYLYAAWKLGALPFPLEVSDASPDAFMKALAIYIAQRFQLAYTMIAKPPGKEVMPVGIAFGVIPLYGKRIAWMGDFTWFPWASARNKLECSVHFMNQMRKDWVVIGFADTKTPAARFSERVCRYGVARRVGTVFDLDDGENSGPVAVFQTRKPYHKG